MRLRQGQVWRVGDRYFRIVRLERLLVGYKSLKDLSRPEGTHHEVTKKEFCRLLKGAELLGAPAPVPSSVPAHPPTASNPPPAAQPAIPAIPANPATPATPATPAGG